MGSLAAVVSVTRAAHSHNWTIDSACSKSMTPILDQVPSPVVDATSIKLADNSVIKSSHVGQAALPLSGVSPVAALVVPDLHEPLLSASDLCHKNLAVVFKSDGCKVYN